jgi:hypothetical protein
MFGVNVDFVARSHCSVALITIEDIQVTNLWPDKTSMHVHHNNLKSVLSLFYPGFERCSVWSCFPANSLAWKAGHCKGGGNSDSVPNLNWCHLLLQAILEKFEFFPVKCRVQRALEISKLNLEEKAGFESPIKFKTKARLYA